MGACGKVEVVIKGDVAQVLKTVTAEAAKHGLEVSGDTSKGTIKHKHVKVWGTYIVDQKTKKITIAMNEDTILTSCSKIEKGLHAFFQGK